jgi:FixJ family two-component response regulator
MDVTTGVMQAERPKVLLLEDDTGVRRSLQLLLQAKGYDVRSHASGTSLLADQGARDASCLVADFCLDDVDGIEVLVRMRAEHWPGAAILITAFHSAALADRAKRAGYDAVLEKPLRQNALVDLMAQLLVRPPGPRT